LKIISTNVKIIFYYHNININIIIFTWMIKFYICVKKIMVKWQTIIFFIIIIMELISQNHFSLCLYIFNKHFINNRVIMKNTQKWCEKNLINNINLVIHYNHVEILCKEICGVTPKSFLGHYFEWPLCLVIHLFWWIYFFIKYSHSLWLNWLWLFVIWMI